MKQDRGPVANRWAGIGNTLLFVCVLVGLFYLMYTDQHELAISLALTGIYSELWNLRVSRGNRSDPDAL